ncbi:T6SS immunity protein Tli4 family protein [Trinickia soli]|nr:T6SS immunity protein Tli4 family protein [Trinickia soli]CAB3699210.1 hypothetical protein LMG24076_03336 [Trinickia soli]
MLLSSIIALNCYAKDPQMSETKTYCMGRYLVDVPADAQINGQAYMYRFGLIETDASIETALAFQQKMDEREVELRGGKHKKRYALVGVRRPSSTIRIFELSTELIVGSSAGFGAYVWDDGRTFSMEETAYDPAKFGDILAELQEKLLPHLKARSPDDIPTAPGFCLKDGFITDDGKVPQFESALIGFKFAKWPGVQVTVQTATVTKLGEPKLLERLNMDDVPERFKNLVSKIHTIRRGERAINGRAGEEDLSTVPTGHGYSVHQFRWESQGSHVSDALEPTLVVELESGMTRDGHGNPARPPLTDEEAVAVFDAVSKSLRFRSSESGVITGDTHPSPDLPLGTLAQTGTTCPQTGWWTCPEAISNEIEGGGRQRFEAGSVIPAAQVLGKQSLIDRLTGRREKYSVNTVWKLVAYDPSSRITNQEEGDKR